MAVQNFEEYPKTIIKREEIKKSAPFESQSARFTPSIPNQAKAPGPGAYKIKSDLDILSMAKLNSAKQPKHNTNFDSKNKQKSEVSVCSNYETSNLELVHGSSMHFMDMSAIQDKSSLISINSGSTMLYDLSQEQPSSITKNVKGLKWQKPNEKTQIMNLKITKRSSGDHLGPGSYNTQRIMPLYKYQPSSFFSSTTERSSLVDKKYLPKKSGSLSQRNDFEGDNMCFTEEEKGILAMLDESISMSVDQRKISALKNSNHSNADNSIASYAFGKKNCVSSIVLNQVQQPVYMTSTDRRNLLQEYTPFAKLGPGYYPLKDDLIKKSHRVDIQPHIGFNAGSERFKPRQVEDDPQFSPTTNFRSNSAGKKFADSVSGLKQQQQNEIKVEITKEIKKILDTRVPFNSSAIRKSKDFEDTEGHPGPGAYIQNHAKVHKETPQAFNASDTRGLHFENSKNNGAIENFMIELATKEKDKIRKCAYEICDVKNMNLGKGKHGDGPILKPLIFPTDGEKKLTTKVK